MKTLRQDSWTKENDELLAATVMRYISEGKTQLKAFEEVAEQISRTPAACGYRWNATIRKDYAEEIKQLKKQRNDETEILNPQAIVKEHITLPIVIEYLTNLEEGENVSAVKQLKEELQRERKEKEKIQEQYNDICEEYESLQTMFEQVRKVLAFAEGKEAVTVN